MTITMAQDETFWAAFMARDAKADGSFVVAVKTTGIYCRPSCPAKKPLRKNVEFFALTADARNAGYRACKRCRPDEISTHQRDALSVEEACRTLEAADSAPTLAVLADQAGLSAHHFHRIFKAHTGLTPKAYHQAARARRTADALGSEGTVTAAAFAGGFQSLSRFYDAVALRFGMTPSSIAAGGRGEVLVLAQAKAPLGVVTAAFSRRGVTSIVLTDREEDGAEETKKRFAHAMFLDGGAEFEALMAEVVAATVEPARAEELPLDIRGTAFEERVWAALRKVPVGTTATYAEIARAIDAPTSYRAVARACGSNKLAVAIPCHRIVRTDGSLAGYRWGIERKEALLAMEGGAPEAVQSGSAADAA